jgi:hypothetical protein
MALHLVPATLRWLAVLLLSRVSAGTTLRRALRWTLTILTWRTWRGAVTLTLRRILALRWRRTVLALSLGWILTLLGRVLTLRWVAWRRLLSIALLTAVLAWRSAIATGGWVSLLVLGIIAAIDSTKEELDDPEIGSEVDRGVGTRHLLLLVLVVCHCISKHH